MRVALILFATLAALGTAGQRSVFRAQETLVLLNVTVTDDDGRIVEGLQQNAFSVLEDDKHVRIAHFDEGAEALRVMILLDASGSMEGSRIGRARDAVLDFVGRLGPDDRVLVAAFSRRLVALTSWTRNIDEIQAAIAHVRPSGPTALYEAIYGGIESLREEADVRSAIVIISDGNDAVTVRPSDRSSLFYTRDTAAEISMEALRRSSALLYAVAVGGKTAEPANEQSLERFARTAGGYTEIVADDKAPRTAMERIAQELRSQYMLAFEPTEPSDKRFHKIVVQIDGCRCTARAREGFKAHK